MRSTAPSVYFNMAALENTGSNRRKENMETRRLGKTKKLKVEAAAFLYSAHETNLVSRHFVLWSFTHARRQFTEVLVTEGLYIRKWFSLLKSVV